MAYVTASSCDPLNGVSPILNLKFSLSMVGITMGYFSYQKQKQKQKTTKR